MIETPDFPATQPTTTEPRDELDAVALEAAAKELWEGPLRNDGHPYTPWEECSPYVRFRWTCWAKAILNAHAAAYLEAKP